MNLIAKLSLASVALLALAGCATVASPQEGPALQTYSYSETGRAQRVVEAVVIDIRPVLIEKPKGTMNLGSLVGAVIGAAAGRQVGHGSTRDAATILGGIAGGSIGGSVNRSATRANGVEIYLNEIEGGRTYAVVQAYDNGVRIGDRVFVTGSGRNLRITPASR